MIHTSRDVSLPPPETIDPWVLQVDLLLRQIVRDINTDFTQGNSTLEIFTDLPSIDEIDEGQRFLFWTGEELRLYTQYKDDFYYTTLTKEVE